MLQTTFLDGRHIAYWEGGDPKGPPVLLVHGLGGDHRGLIGCTTALGSCRLIIPDLPGYGLSAPLQTTHSLQAYADFLDTFRAQLDIERLAVLGHSFGAAIALTYAASYPKRLTKLILLNPVVGASHSRSTRLGTLYMTIACLFPERIAHALVCNKAAVYVTDRAVMTRGGKPYRKKILREDYTNYRRASVRAMQEGIASLAHTTIRTLTPQAHVATYIIAGKKDTVSSMAESNQLATALAAQYTVIDEGGHLYPLEDPDHASMLVQQFLNGKPLPKIV